MEIQEDTILSIPKEEDSILHLSTSLSELSDEKCISGSFEIRNSIVKVNTNKKTQKKK